MTGKSIIITGAGSGIGRVTARTFLAAGWRVGLIRLENVLVGAAVGISKDVERRASDLVDAGAAKALRAGASLLPVGVTKVEEPGQLASALVAAYAYGPVAVIEQFLTGTEVAVRGKFVPHFRPGKEMRNRAAASAVAPDPQRNMA